MKKIEDKNTRYYIDIDVKTKKVLKWDFGQREMLITEKLEHESERRIFITKGQYHKLLNPETSPDN